ncbi:MAG: MFS transporter [Acidovorax sp. 17-64-282]|jgi:MFS family permease|uniref:MFS transporter n=1 Tax=Polaromonas aquatica TaxID=332657 RepID=A0ABW1TYU5_9BURK|nr:MULTISPECIES: MFS transporter [Comamonadaceae]OZA55581.1 MAG: MFS transporter [Acidovorax sp. 17-64-282]HQT51008.1 MFS transporter [Acidovorax defluvii]OYY84902.1 MAG: MFS transporter [Acidovorax sp. 28-64-14]OYZ42117.1 MAG: MFS transporter [Acidovorax sp. 16-64-162]OYZ76966.1 MAG: MFS transporter [Polaromonas sp. 24-63-21]
MLEVLANRTYRHLFLAQVIALLGTGLATVALGLLAFDLAGANAGAVLGTALAIKMLAYIGVAPVASALAERLPRRAVLVALDLVRAAVALILPFVTQIWEIYVLIFVLQSASAAFTPTFQATIPDVLPDEGAYTKALSLSRLAYDLENLVSPMLAALLLTVVSFHSLFGGTVVGFLASAALVVSAVLPRAKTPPKRSIYERTTRGLRIYLATPRLRALLALNLAIASGSAMVIVNTVVLVQAGFGLTQTATAIALACFGAGSMLIALVLPKVLDRVPERRAMLVGASVIAIGLLVGAALASRYAVLLPLWFVLGLGYSLAQTPSGRLLRRSSGDADRPALFAAQFALSHACWLITYPLAGWLGAKFGLTISFVTLGVVASAAVLLSMRLWPSDDPVELSHRHDNLAAGHPHLAGESDARPPTADREHSHAYVIDDEHQRWPSR